MLVLDNITIVICIFLVILAFCSSLFDTFFRKFVDKEETDSMEEQKPVSVIIISDNNARELNDNLKYFLSQDYSAGYEVIVVVCRDEDGTCDVLKSFEKEQKLYTTFVPDTSRYMSRRKLAITLGVKAAKNEQVLLTDAVCKPVSEHWISSMISKCRDEIDLVIGYSNYAEGTSQFKIFSRLHSEYAFLYDAFKGFAYSTCGNNLLFRKSVFMDGRGFQGNLKYLRGEYSFLVNKYSGNGNVAIATSNDCMVVETPPSNKTWKDTNLFYIETRKHLKRSFRHRFIFNIDMFSLHVCLIFAILSVLYAILYAKWLILLFSFIAFFVPVVYRTISAKRVMNSFNVHVNLWKVFPFEWALLWKNLKYAYRYRVSDKYEYISHKS